MASFVKLTLDTTGPQNPSLSLNNNAIYVNNQVINATIGTTDPQTTGYQVKIWGDLDIQRAITDGLLPAGASISNRDNAQWITYTTDKQIKLSNGDGNKTISIVIRDDVWNESAEVSKSITYDSTLPVVTVTAPDVNKVSKIAGKDSMTFTFTCSEDIVEYKVKVVPSEAALESTGTQIPSSAGSVNVQSSNEVNADDVISVTIKGTDLWTASSADGEKIIKVFCKDSTGNWSV